MTHPTNPNSDDRDDWPAVHPVILAGAVVLFGWVFIGVLILCGWALLNLFP